MAAIARCRNGLDQNEVAKGHVLQACQIGRLDHCFELLAEAAIAGQAQRLSMFQQIIIVQLISLEHVHDDHLLWCMRRWC